MVIFRHFASPSPTQFSLTSLSPLFPLSFPSLTTISIPPISSLSLSPLLLSFTHLLTDPPSPSFFPFLPAFSYSIFPFLQYHFTHLTCPNTSFLPFLPYLPSFLPTFLFPSFHFPHSLSPITFSYDLSSVSSPLTLTVFPPFSLRLLPISPPSLPFLAVWCGTYLLPHAHHRTPRPAAKVRVVISHVIGLHVC